MRHHGGTSLCPTFWYRTLGMDTAGHFTAAAINLETASSRAPFYRGAVDLLLTFPLHSWKAYELQMTKRTILQMSDSVFGIKLQMWFFQLHLAEQSCRFVIKTSFSYNTHWCMWKKAFSWSALTHDQTILTVLRGYRFCFLCAESALSHNLVNSWIATFLASFPKFVWFALRIFAQPPALCDIPKKFLRIRLTKKDRTNTAQRLRKFCKLELLPL